MRTRPTGASAATADEKAPSSSSAEPLDLVTWKSTLGVHKASSSGTLKATSKGWGRSGAITDAVLTRHGTVEGFLAVLPNPNTSLFIGFSTMTSGSLTDKGRAHQEDLAFALRLAADGTLSYASAAKMQQFYHSQSMEGDTLTMAEKGDAVGMKFTPDRKGIVILRSPAAMAAAQPPQPADGSGGAARPRPSYTVLKTVSEVISFPMRLMVVFGGTTSIGPITSAHQGPAGPVGNLTSERSGHDL